MFLYFYLVFFYIGAFLYFVKTNRLNFHEKEKKEHFINEYINQHTIN